jgi:hypothetical protein
VQLMCRLQLLAYVLANVQLLLLVQVGCSFSLVQLLRSLRAAFGAACVDTCIVWIGVHTVMFILNTSRTCCNCADTDLARPLASVHYKNL